MKTTSIIILWKKLLKHNIRTFNYLQIVSLVFFILTDASLKMTANTQFLAACQIRVTVTFDLTMTYKKINSITSRFTSVIFLPLHWTNIINENKNYLTLVFNNSGFSTKSLNFLQSNFACFLYSSRGPGGKSLNTSWSSSKSIFWKQICV